MQAKIWNHSEWIKETDPSILKILLKELLISSGFEVLGFTEHHFHPYGYTALWLLAESHLAVHTFPEEEKSYVELSSCMLDKYMLFLKLLKESNWG